MPPSRGEFAVSATVAEINEESQQEPNGKTEPGDDGQADHQSEAERDRNQRKPGHKRHAKSARGRSAGFRFDKVNFRGYDSFVLKEAISSIIVIANLQRSAVYV